MSKHSKVISLGIERDSGKVYTANIIFDQSNGLRKRLFWIMAPEIAFSVNKDRTAEQKWL